MVTMMMILCRGGNCLCHGNHDWQYVHLLDCRPPGDVHMLGCPILQYMSYLETKKCQLHLGWRWKCERLLATFGNRRLWVHLCIQISAYSMAFVSWECVVDGRMCNNYVRTSKRASIWPSGLNWRPASGCLGGRMTSQIWSMRDQIDSLTWKSAVRRICCDPVHQRADVIPARPSVMLHDQPESMMLKTLNCSSWVHSTHDKLAWWWPLQCFYAIETAEQTNNCHGWHIPHNHSCILAHRNVSITRREAWLWSIVKWFITAKVHNELL